MSSTHVHHHFNNNDLSHQLNKEIHPFVYWGQSATHISLRVDLIQVQNLQVNITDAGNKLTFSAEGKGAHGLNNYYFEINFHSQVETKFDCHTIERYVLLLIKKVIQPAKWQRLTQGTTKLAWLRFDFDRYTGEDSDSDKSLTSDDHYNNIIDKGDDIAKERKRQETYEQLKQRQREVRARTSLEEERQVCSDNRANWRECFDKIEKSSQSNYIEDKKMDHEHRKDNGPIIRGKNSAKHLTYKKTYLFLYNLAMFVMFLKVYMVLLIKLSNGTMDDEILQGAAFIIRMLTYTQLLETLHPILGLVPGGPFMPFLQVIGRIIVNLFLTEPVIRLDANPYAHYLFVVWCSIEIIRYPFYALRVFKINIYSLTWCRYSLFVPLYPMGGFFESMVVFSTIKHYEHTGEYSLSLPNQANFSFSLPTFLRIYVFFLLGPSIYSLMKYMWSQRAKQLKEKEKED